MSPAGEAITPDAVHAAAVLADLPLTPQRATDVAALLASWLPAAHALNTRMQAEDLRGLAPAVTFTQGAEAQEAGG